MVKIIYNQCEFTPSSPGIASASDEIRTPIDGGHIVINNSIINPVDIASYTPLIITNGVYLRISNSSISSVTTKPVSLVRCDGGGGGTANIENSDLSNLSSGVELLESSAASDEDVIKLILTNCKLPAIWTMGAPGGPAGFIKVSNCNSGNNRSINAYKDIFGYAITDNTTHRDSSDQVEGQDVSMEVVTTAAAKVGMPFRFLLTSIRHDFSSQTYVDVQIVHDDIGSGTASAMQNDEIYLEVEVPNSADPGSTLKTNGPEAVLTYTPSDHTGNSEAGTTPPTADNTQVMTVDCGAAGGEGWADIYVCVPLASVAAGELNVCTTVVTRAS